MIHALCLALTMTLSAHIPAQAQTIASLADRYRILLVFAPTPQDPQLQQQIKAFNHHESDLRDRDLLIIPVVANSVPPIAPDTLRLLNPPAVSPQEQLTLRTRFHVQPSDFAAVLLGKDGGEKFRSHTPVAPAKLNQIIDAMPMRRDEMKQKTTPPLQP